MVTKQHETAWKQADKLHKNKEEKELQWRPFFGSLPSPFFKLLLLPFIPFFFPLQLGNKNQNLLDQRKKDENFLFSLSRVP